jgi:hypothetical protein
VATLTSVDAGIDWFQRRHAWLGFPLSVDGIKRLGLRRLA